jgi:methylated-DNA-[protein]-cysteine S-methyltransferase
MNRYTVIPTTWGYFAAVWSELGLKELSYPRPDVQQALADIQCSPAPVPGDDCFAAELTDELKLYLQGYAVDFSTPIDWEDYTPFQREVLQYTATIPYGQTRTYREVAIAIGHPLAARAVGGALHINRTPIVVPCHRVLGSNGSLTGFGGGIEMKQALLLLEKYAE